MAATRITLPGTDLKVSRICLGCWQFNGGKDTVNWDAQTPEVGVISASTCFIKKYIGRKVNIQLNHEQ